MSTQEISPDTLTETAATHENTTDTATKATPKKRRCRLGRCLLWTTLGILLLPLAVLVGLSTEQGQHSALKLADRLIEPLAIGAVEGRLQEGLRLKQIAFNTQGVNVQAGQADLHIGFGCMLDYQACLENIALQDVTVNVDTSQLPPSQAQQTKEAVVINLPLLIALKKVSLDNIQVSVDDMDIALAHFHSGIHAEGKQFQIQASELRGLRLMLPPQAVESAEKNEKKAPEKREKVDWNAVKQTLSQPLLSKLEAFALPLDLNISRFEAQDIVIGQKNRNAHDEIGESELVNVAKVLLVAENDTHQIRLHQFDIESDKGNLSGQGSVALKDNYPLDISLHAKAVTVPQIDLPSSDIQAKLSGELFGTTTLEVQTQGAFSAQLAGEVQLNAEKTPLTLRLSSPKVRYPFQAKKGQDPLVVENFSLALDGDLLNYQLDSRLSLNGMGIPATNLALQGQGELTHFDLHSEIGALQGLAKLKGRLDWQDGIEWNAAIELANVQTHSLLPEWAATLSGKLISQGFAGRGEQGDKWAVSLSEMDLNGLLLQKKLALQGEVNLGGGQLLSVPQAQLLYGENRIALSGVLGEKSDFNADIHAPNLRGLLPELSASLQGKVKLLGKVSEPNIDLDLVADKVAYRDFKLQHLSAKGSVTTQSEIQGKLNLALKQLQIGDIRVENATVNAEGSERDHRLSLNSKGKPVGADFTLRGQFDRAKTAWIGQLANTLIRTEFGDWKNDQAVSIAYDNAKIQAEIGAHCWQNPRLGICFPRAFRAGAEGSVPFEIRRFDLAMVQPFLAENSRLSGVLSAKGNAAWFKDKAPQVEVEVNSDSVKFVQKIDYRSLPLTITPLKVNAKLADNNLQLKTQLRLQNNGSLNSDILMSDLAGRRALSGNIQLDKLSLSLISPLLGKGERVQGGIDAKLSLGGTALAPLLHGNLNLSGLKARANAMPFDITDGKLGLIFAGHRSTLSGSIKTPDSELKLDGDADWHNLAAWHTRVHAQANRFKVNVPKIARVEVSPNIEVKATPERLNLSGNIDLPWARIEVEELPESAVSVSGDEVIMDSRTARKKIGLADVPPQTKSGMAINADIKIHIGDDVKLNAYGLKTDLNGDLMVRQGAQGLGLYGQVYLKNGSYASFGQDLVIRKGMINFGGLPSQPSLDIEAIRNPEAIEDTNVTAGVKISGLADSPEVKIFSEPGMSQDQALSYILTGRSLESGGDASGNSIAAALIGMSLSKSSKLVGGVGSAFGLNDLSVTTAGIGDNTKVVASASLTPKFRVKYGVGIFAPLTELTLRYRLAPSLYLQWMSSINQAVDLMYRFEF